jgi:hypothetical protein
MPEPGEDVEGDPAGQVGVPKAVLGEAQAIHDPVGLGDERGEDRMLLDVVDREQSLGRRGLGRTRASFLLHEPALASSPLELSGSP